MNPLDRIDPTALTDADIATAADLLHDLARSLLRDPSAPMDGATVTALDPASRWAVDFLSIGWQMLKSEDNRRTETEAAIGLLELERFLAEGP